MEYNWNREFHNVGLVWEPKIVRVLNDGTLKDCLSSKARRHSYALAAYARDVYKKQYGRELKITEKSLACEIYWHYIIREASLWVEKKFRQMSFTRWLIYHMDVIDCGERDVDNNRFVWNVLSFLF